MTVSSHGSFRWAKLTRCAVFVQVLIHADIVMMTVLVQVQQPLSNFQGIGVEQILWRGVVLADRFVNIDMTMAHDLPGPSIPPPCVPLSVCTKRFFQVSKHQTRASESWTANNSAYLECCGGLVSIGGSPKCSLLLMMLWISFLGMPPTFFFSSQQTPSHSQPTRYY